MFNENLDAFLEDFGVIAVVNGGNTSFFVLFDEFHSRMDWGRRSVIDCYGKN